ncbi:MAG: NF038122 family metalloprotease, partial [Planctomycetota bacterium]
ELRLEPLQPRRLFAADFPFVPAEVGIGGFPVESPLEIEFLYGPGIRGNAEAQRLVERAADRWRQHIQDPVTLFIEIDLVSNLPPAVLGGALSTTSFVSYGSLRQALISDASIEPDDAIVQSLPAAGDLAFNADNGITVLPSVQLNTASAKALGQLTPDDPDYILPDATIVLNADFFQTVVNPGGIGTGGPDPDVPDVPPGVDPGDLQLNHLFVPPRSDPSSSDPSSGDSSSSDPSSGNSTSSDSTSSGLNQTVGVGGPVQSVNSIENEFEAVVVHEIGHVLGFRSGIDDINDDNELIPTAMDLFRFASDLRTLNPDSPEEFSTLPRELRTNVNVEIDFVLDPWSTGRSSFPVERGVGLQASHWLDEDLAGSNIGIMDPTIGLGSVSTITLADLRMFDLLGWDIAPPGETLSQIVIDPRLLPQDVNRDGVVSPVDALTVINALRREADSDASTRRAFDVNADGVTSAIDALMIINYLSRVSSESGEASFLPSPSPAQFDDRLLLLTDAVLTRGLF